MNDGRFLKKNLCLKRIRVLRMLGGGEEKRNFMVYFLSVIINGGPTAKLMMFKWDCYQILTELMVFKLEKLTSSCVLGLRLLSLKNKLCRVEIF